MSESGQEGVGWNRIVGFAGIRGGKVPTGPVSDFQRSAETSSMTFLGNESCTLSNLSWDKVITSLHPSSDGFSDHLVFCSMSQNQSPHSHAH